MARLLEGLHSDFERGSVGLDNYLLCLFATTLVPRPIQVSWLKAIDLVRLPPGGIAAYRLSMPRAKQRVEVRGKFTKLGLRPGFGDLLWRQREDAIRSAAKLGIAEYDAPMFLGKTPTGAVKPSVRLPLLAHHLSRHAVSQRVKAALNRIGVLSDRTGRPLNIHWLRLRRTGATLAYASGASLEEISALLDHTDPNMCLAYIERSQELFARVAAAAGPRRAEMARAMLSGRRRAG